MGILRYEWDPAKNLWNQRKHGISFELAALVFEGECCLVRLPEAVAVLLVVHVYRDDDHGEEIIRIISARAADKHDIRRYQEQAMD